MSILMENFLGKFVVITCGKSAAVNNIVQTNEFTVSNTAFYYLMAFTVLHD